MFKKVLTIKRLLVILSALSVISVAFPGKTFYPNYSGNWKINYDKTDLGRWDENAVAGKLIVMQTPDSFVITRSVIHTDGTSEAYTERLPFNSNPAACKRGTDVTKSSIVKWSTDNKALTEKSDYTNSNADKLYNATETYTLSEDGKMLTVLRIDDSEKDGHGEAKFVYEKQ